MVKDEIKEVQKKEPVMEETAQKVTVKDEKVLDEVMKIVGVSVDEVQKKDTAKDIVQKKEVQKEKSQKKEEFKEVKVQKKEVEDQKKEKVKEEIMVQKKDMKGQKKEAVKEEVLKKKEVKEEKVQKKDVKKEKGQKKDEVKEDKDKKKDVKGQKKAEPKEEKIPKKDMKEEKGVSNKDVQKVIVESKDAVQEEKVQRKHVVVDDKKDGKEITDEKVLSKDEGKIQKIEEKQEKVPIKQDDKTDKVKKIEEQVVKTDEKDIIKDEVKEVHMQKIEEKIDDKILIKGNISKSNSGKKLDKELKSLDEVKDEELLIRGIEDKQVFKEQELKKEVPISKINEGKTEKIDIVKEGKVHVEKIKEVIPDLRFTQSTEDTTKLDEMELLKKMVQKEFIKDDEEMEEFIKSSDKVEVQSKPYVTTPTQSRRVSGIGGSQRLSREERPTVRIVTDFVEDSSESESESEQYIVTEPVERRYPTRKGVKFRFDSEDYREDRASDGEVEEMIEEIEEPIIVEQTIEPKLTKTERKFERMASDTIGHQSKTNEGEYQQIISQMSMEEVNQALEQWEKEGLTPSESDSKDTTEGSDHISPTSAAVQGETLKTEQQSKTVQESRQREGEEESETASGHSGFKSGFSKAPSTQSKK